MESVPVLYLSLDLSLYSQPFSLSVQVVNISIMTHIVISPLSLIILTTDGKKSLPSLNFRKCQIQNFRSFLKVQGEFQCF